MKPQIDFNDLTPFISDDTYKAMAAVTKDSTSCGWNLNREADLPVIEALRHLRDATGVNFITNERNDGFIELNNFGRDYIIWRQRREARR